MKQLLSVIIATVLALGCETFSSHNPIPPDHLLDTDTKLDSDSDTTPDTETDNPVPPGKDGADCDAPDKCDSGHCDNNLCCKEGNTCCNALSDDQCGNFTCDTTNFTCNTTCDEQTPCKTDNHCKDEICEADKDNGTMRASRRVHLRQLSKRLLLRRGRSVLRRPRRLHRHGQPHLLHTPVCFLHG